MGDEGLFIPWKLGAEDLLIGLGGILSCSPCAWNSEILSEIDGKTSFSQFCCLCASLHVPKVICPIFLVNIKQKSTFCDCIMGNCVLNLNSMRSLINVREKIPEHIWIIETQSL